MDYGLIFCEKTARADEQSWIMGSCWIMPLDLWSNWRGNLGEQQNRGEPPATLKVLISKLRDIRISAMMTMEFKLELGLYGQFGQTWTWTWQWGRDSCNYCSCWILIRQRAPESQNLFHMAAKSPIDIQYIMVSGLISVFSTFLTLFLDQVWIFKGE